MTMHVVLGSGEMSRRELTEALADLMKADAAAEQTFWFLIQGKSEPTDTDKALVGWLEKNDVYYEIITDDESSVSEIYTQPQEIHTTKKLKEKVVSLLQSKPETDEETGEIEPAEVLALFFDANDVSAAEDRWLNGVIQGAFTAGFKSRALNDGLVDIDVTDTPEETPTPAKANGATKKAAPRTPVPEEDATVEGYDDPEQPVQARPKRAALEAMEPSEVKELAASLGISLPPRTRVTTYIDHILGDKTVDSDVPEVTVAEEVAEIAATNGHIDYDMLADMVAGRLWERIRQAASSV